MRSRTKVAVAAIAMSGLGVVGMDTYTYAGTGDSMILGKFNKSNQTTHVTSTGNGPALSLHAKGKRPPLAIDSNAKVLRLNADTVDGQGAADLQNTVRVFSRTEAESSWGNMHLRLPDVPAGRYQVTYAITVNPTTGGGVGADLYCYLQADGRYAGYAGGVFVDSSNSAGASAADVLVNRPDDEWFLSCQSESGGVLDFEISSSFPARVTLTRIDETVSGQLGVPG